MILNVSCKYWERNMNVLAKQQEIKRPRTQKYQKRTEKVPKKDR